MESLSRRVCRICEPEAQRRYQASGDRRMKALADARWQVHGVERYCRKTL